MAKLLLKYSGKDSNDPGTQVTLDNVVEAGVASDFLIIRHTDGVVVFLKTGNIDSVQFDPTEDQSADAESTDDTND